MNTLRIARLSGYALLALTAAWAGVHVYSGRHTSTARAQTAAVAVPIGEASPPSETDIAAESPQIGPLSTTIPAKIPEFTLSDLHGKPTPISTWRGKSLVLNFWATWCAPCRREIPLLKSVQQDWAARQVEVVGVAVDYREKVDAYVGELKIPYPILVGEQDALDVATALGVSSPVFPFTVFTDRRGQLVALYIGELHKPQADLILGVVETLNREAVTLPEARRQITDGLQALKTDRAS